MSRNSSRLKLERETLDIVTAELCAAGVIDWTVTKTKRGHTFVDFYRGGKLHRVMFSGTTDWRARLNVRRDVRGILEGRR